MRYLISALAAVILLSGCTVRVIQPEPVVVEVPSEPIIVRIPERVEVPVNVPKEVKVPCYPQTFSQLKSFRVLDKEEFKSASNPKESVRSYVKALEKNNALLESIVEDFNLGRFNCNE